MATQRWGVTIPLSDQLLREQVDLFRQAEELGYTDIWSSEVNQTDVFTPLILAAQATERAVLGTAIVNVYTRTPAMLAMHAATLNELAPGRVILGLGTSSIAIVQQWSGVPLKKPLTRMRDAVTVIKQMLKGEKVNEVRETLSAQNFRLQRPVEQVVPVYVAALRSRMLRLAGELADGVILNLLAAKEVPLAVKEVREAAEKAGRDPSTIPVACRIFVCPTRSVEEGDEVARRFLAGYLTVPTYTAFQDWLGHSKELAPALEAWAAGDRKRAVREIPQHLVDELVIVGPPELCREKVLAYCKEGVDIPILQIFKTAKEPADNSFGLRELAPSK